MHGFGMTWGLHVGNIFVFGWSIPAKYNRPTDESTK